jgi:type II secretory ATPase GspE/PulE/Tfp pilus assembly ATPase PilB-like protein
VTGPTGSGKSTSLYTFLSSINTTNRRIVTIEDPVEHKVNGVIQIAVKSEIGLTFAAGLRSILRGDPNVVMIGEMRDLETAEIAIRAALTGHLVFSTLHTNDAIGGITRLIDMGVEPFLVASAVRAFLAQRLVRTLCSHCRTPAGAHYPQAYLKELGFPLAEAGRIMRPVGCEKCRNSGYSGRTAIFEMAPVSERLQDAITTRKTGNQLRDIAREEGMISLREYGWSRVAAGVTSVEEVVRVTTADVEVQDQ